MTYNINIVWDNEAEVWVATSDDIVGLVAEDDSFENLIKRLRVIAAELIELNHLPLAETIKYSAVYDEKVIA